ncbi:MAG TPA: phosphate ABC transporter ATP-binding protein [Planctomycetota bacterium]|nr:phosphate ABC transporter ATP-binding protein [Planctomycetota bacterium]
MIEVRKFSAWYGPHAALQEVSLEVRAHEILGVIGPSGGGKTTLLRSFNRMNDLIPDFRRAGFLKVLGVDIYADSVDIAELRRTAGMVFAVPVPLPGTIRDNLRLGPRFDGRKRDLDSLVEKCLKASYLWEEVKDRLDQSAFTLSGGQQQRLCLARTLMLEPDILLLDEPCSGLDPISTAKIEEALQELKGELTIVLVTNNVMQASRVADRTAFFFQGRLIECDSTEAIFVNPKEKTTYDYISGRFG